MKQENLMKIFNKYGFHSLNKEPFLYEKKDELGIAYTFKDDFYGQLTRIFIPKDLEEAENFLAKYCWYKKNGKKYNITLKLDDYKKENGFRRSSRIN